MSLKSIFKINWIANKKKVSKNLKKLDLCHWIKNYF